MPFDSSPIDPREEYSRRLLVLADFLDHLPARKFCLSNWVLLDSKKRIRKMCAIGWATQIEEFNHLGFRLRRPIGNPHNEPEFGFHIHWEAVRSFFGIPLSVSKRLFFEETYPRYWNVFGLKFPRDPRPRECAKRIRAYVNDPVLVQ